MKCLIYVAAVVFLAGTVALADVTAPAEEDLPRKERVSQGHITWHFDDPVPVGRFVNGDYYVVGPVTIVKMDPEPKDGRNLSTLNLDPGGRGDRAFDDRMRGHDPEAVARLPIRMDPGDMLVSSVSTDKSEHRCLFDRENNKSWTLSYSILTSLEEPVPPDTFRPGYCDRSMRMYRARDLQWERLNDLKPVEDTPDIDRWAGFFRQPWIDLMGFCWGGAAEYQPQYARETARAEAFATLLLNLDFPKDQKRPLLTNFVQYGIDLWSIVQHPAEFIRWRANGGHGSGRKWAIVFAGMMLGDEEMASPTETHPDFMFGQDMQTMYDRAWTGADVVYAGHRGVWKGEPAGTNPAHKPYEHLDPVDWPTGSFQYEWMDEPRSQYTGEVYRRMINSPVWVGMALAGRIMQAEQFYAHDAFFDYVDRWMTEDDAFRKEIVEQIDEEKSRHDFRDDRFRTGRVSDPFVEQMWETYRAPQLGQESDGEPLDRSQ